jgi:hypothetical protein
MASESCTWLSPGRLQSSHSRRAIVERTRLSKHEPRRTKGEHMSTSSKGQGQNCLLRPMRLRSRARTRIALPSLENSEPHSSEKCRRRPPGVILANIVEGRRRRRLCAGQNLVCCPDTLGLGSARAKFNRSEPIGVRSAIGYMPQSRLRSTQRSPEMQESQRSVREICL